MDPVTAVGLTASIIQIINATAQAIQFLEDFNDAPKDRAKISSKAANLLALLTSLRYRMAEANLKDAWSKRLLALGGDGGPLDQYKQAIENLAERLKQKSGVKDLQKRLKWTLDKKHIKETLDEIEQLKTLISLALQEDNFELSLRIKKDISNVGQDLVGISQTVAKLSINQHLSLGRDLDEERQAAISWLSPLNFSTKQNDILNRHQNGTGRWLLEAEEFRSWLSGDKRYLWCPGLPGGGKTVLTSIVVNYLEQTFLLRDAAVIYIYNSYKEHDEQSATNLIGSLLQQVVRKKSVVSDGIMTMYRLHSAQRTRPSLSELSSSLRLESKNFTHVFVLVDALDECAEENGVRESLLKELHGHLVEPNTHLMITSRFIAGLEYDSNEVKFLEIRASDDDIEMYLHCRILKERRLARHVENDENLHDAIIKTIVNNAKGMFLLAQLHLDSLAKKHNKRDVRLALNSLPEELTGTYDQAMHRIYSQPAEDVALAKRVLSWISCAKRPLTVLELQHALAVEPEALDIDVEALTEEDILVSVCIGLVTIEEGSSIIRLAHFTTQEYFERNRTRHFPTAETDIAFFCLTYLSFDGYATLRISPNEVRKMRDQYALLRYVSTYWAAHTRGAPEENSQVQRLAFQLLENKDKVLIMDEAHTFAAGREEGSLYDEWGIYSGYDISGLPIAASSGLITITTLLLDRGARTEKITPQIRGTALLNAARTGHGAIVKLLLKRGAQIDATNYNQMTALMLATELGHELVVKVLLENGAAIEARNRRNETALNLAASRHNIAVMTLLLDSGADINTKNCYGTALMKLVVEEKGATSTIRFLLERGADVNIRDGKDMTLLSCAVSRRSSTLVGLLLGAGADVNARGGSRDRTVLFKPVSDGDNDMVQLLLGAGIDIHIKNNYGETAIFHGTDRDNGYTTRLLLDAGAELNTKDNFGRTALFEAALRDLAAMVQLLLNEGADVNMRDNEGRTALFEATRRDRTALRLSSFTGWAYLDTRTKEGMKVLRDQAAVVHLLLKKGADVNTRDDDGRTALFAPATTGATAVVQLLLQGGANMDTKDNDGRTALLAAAGNGSVAVVQLLIKDGADVHTVDNRGRTVLHEAVCKERQGYERDDKYNRRFDTVVQLLLEAGADFHARDDHGDTALALAIQSDHTGAVQLLLHAGAKFDARLDVERTALHVAAERISTSPLQSLVHAGAELDARDDLGRTALHFAAKRGYTGAVQLLLDAGADLNTRDDLERTALHAAAECEGDPTRAVQSLLHAGAEVNARDDLGRTALHVAAECKWEFTRAVESLLHAGAEVDARDDFGRTALHVAAKWEWNPTGAVQLLLSAGAELDARDDFGRTALHVAAKWNSTSAVQLLLSAGADYELKAHDIEDAQVIGTPLEIAISMKSWTVVKLLPKAKKRQETEEESLGTSWDWTETGDLVLPIQTEVALGI